jgi:hypothetical protein
MTRENVTTKATRILVEGRLILTSIASGVVEGTVRGEGYLYRVGYRPESGWSCQCAARGSRGACSHLLAVRRCVAVDLLEPRGRTQ